MSVDTKAVVVTDVKDFFEIVGCIHNSIRLIIAEAYGYPSNEFSLPKIHVTESTLNSGCMTIDFKYKGESRILNINFFCDCDLREDVYNLNGDSGIIMSLGYWGFCIELMEHIAKDLADHVGGSAYILDNDCSSKEFRLI